MSNRPHPVMAAPRSFDDYLQPDMQSRILINHGLPIKSLLMFKSVSRGSNSLISSSSFISEHFKFNLTKSSSDRTNNNNGYLLCNTIERGLSTVLCNTDHTLTEIFSFKIPIDYDRIVGFCNGILCLVRERYEVTCDSPPDSDKRIYTHTCKIYLCNPSIRAFEELPPAHMTVCLDGVACGLGYNSENQYFDFKVLRFGRFYEPAVDGLDFQVYSLNANSWTQLGPFKGSRGPTTKIDESSGLFFNGALLFIAESHDHKFILSFDLNNENFREITLPGQYDGLRLERLAELNGSLAWISFGKREGEREQDLTEVCYICEMKVSGADESWTERTLQLEDVESFFGCTGNGELVIKKSSIPNQLFLFHPVTRGEKNIDIGDFAPVIYTPKFIESLILLK